jgi:hypothetical protein
VNLADSRRVFAATVRQICLVRHQPTGAFRSGRALLRHGAEGETVKTLRIKRQAQRSQDERRDSSPLRRNGGPYIGAHADYRREDFVFARQQSLAMRQMEWESRLRPIKPWGSNLVANLAFEIFA